MPRDRSAHRARMSARRARQLARTPGFDHMPNERLDREFAKVFIDQVEMLKKSGMDEIFATQFAYRAALSTLPHLPIARRHRAPRPSKSDSAEYRKQAVAA